MSANTQNFRVKNGLDVTGNTSLNANLAVSGATSISNTLTVANTLTTQSIQAGNTVTISNTKLTISGPNIEGSNDAIEVTRGATNLRDVYITGDLQVTGVTSLTSTETFEVGTNQIVMSAGLKGDEAPTTNGNIVVNRGSSANVYIRWDEVNDRWMFTDDGSAIYPLKTYSDIVYQFSNAGDASPASGEIAFNSTSIASITIMSISESDVGGQDVSSFFADVFASTGTSTLGHVILRSSTDQSKYFAFTVDSYSSAAGVTDLGITEVSGSASLFDDNDVVFLQIYRGGSKGEKGATGATGATGDKGEKGEKGEVGSKGEKGEKGEKGAQIDSASYDSDTDTVTFTYADTSSFDFSGIKGDKGEKGEVGSKGEKGEKGEVGATGATGDKGDKGEKGEVGATGATGPTGPTGAKGEVITSGSYNSVSDEVTYTLSDTSTFNVGGLKGGKGEAGTTGDKGQKGDKGADSTVQGPTGDKGDKGDKGEKGEVGATGTNGTDGINGTKGEKGEIGAVGYNQDAQVNSLGAGTPASGTTGEIRATNNITAYYSDDRLKTRISNLANALEKVKSLNGFYYKANELAQSYGYESKIEVGVSAQEVQAVLPEVVVPAPIDDQFLTVRYEKMIPLLIEAVKELSDIVDKLQQDR